MNKHSFNSDSDPGRAYMRALRRDHAGLSRVLRAIDTQAARLTREPEQARTVLSEAMSYLLRYHHAFHHPREDRLFARIRAQDTALDQTLVRLSDEHETGEHQAERLVRDLAAASLRQLRGRAGTRLTRRVNDYVGHTRAHMRHEEAVFYARAENVLKAEDWRAVIEADHGPQDPIADLAGMGSRYPHLAAELGVLISHLGLVERSQPLNDQMRLQVLALTDLYGGLLHDAADLTRANLARLLAVRGPGSLVRAFGDMTSDNMRFVGRCLVQPPRWAVNSGAALLVASLRPYLQRQPPPTG